MKELSLHIVKACKDLEIPWQNTFKDKPAFIKRLIKVLVALSGTRPFCWIISRRGKGRREKGRKDLENRIA